MLQPFLIILGTVLGATAAGTFGHPLWRWLRILAWFAVVYELGYFLSGSRHWVGGLAAGGWFVWPFLLGFARVRGMRIAPLERIRPIPSPDDDVFPELEAMTEELEAAGFAAQEELGSQDDAIGQRRYARVFLSEEKKRQCFVVHEEFGNIRTHYLILRSLSAAGINIVTSNHPAPGAARPDDYSVRFKDDSILTLADLCNAHEDNEDASDAPMIENVEMDDENAEPAAFLEAEHRAAMEINVAMGVLQPSANGMLRYTWRGAWSMWLTLARDMLIHN